jgi:hypothetical protein
LVCTAKNGYCFPTRVDHCYLAKTQHHFEWPTDAISRPEWNGIGDTLGCGVLLNPKNELAIFFTATGMLMGQFCIGIWQEQMSFYFVMQKIFMLQRENMNLPTEHKFISNGIHVFSPFCYFFVLPPPLLF